MSKQQPLRTPSSRLTKASKQSQAVVDTRDIRTLFAALLPHLSGALPTDANEGLPRPATLAIAVSVEPVITRHCTLSLSSSNVGMKAVIEFPSSPPVNVSIARHRCRHPNVISLWQRRQLPGRSESEFRGAWIVCPNSIRKSDWVHGPCAVASL
ncbi:hypothetical protein BC830DRAFT_1141854 [Chytriomyces sp. MP71]|nr:hypothetical protein BC830DRAFT_1141854 [Chytriomyces sp. MP71]